MSIYKVDLVDTEIGESEDICYCGCLQKRNINVKNRRETYLRIKDIRTHDNVSAIDNHLHIFYDLLKDTIKEMHPHTFSFNNFKNMAISINYGDSFNDIQVVERFKTKLLSHYMFDAPIDVSKINKRPDEDDINTIPFINIDSDDIAKFVNWVKTRPRSPGSLTNISLGTAKQLKDRIQKRNLPKIIYDRITEDDQ